MLRSQVRVDGQRRVFFGDQFAGSRPALESQTTLFRRESSTLARPDAAQPGVPRMQFEPSSPHRVR